MNICLLDSLIVIIRICGSSEKTAMRRSLSRCGSLARVFEAVRAIDWHHCKAHISGVDLATPWSAAKDEGDASSLEGQDSWTALHVAATRSGRGAPRLVQLLLDNRAPVAAEDSYGRTPLHTAVLSGNSAIAHAAFTCLLVAD